MSRSRRPVSRVTGQAIATSRRVAVRAAPGSTPSDCNRAGSSCRAIRPGPEGCRTPPSVHRRSRNCCLSTLPAADTGSASTNLHAAGHLVAGQSLAAVLPQFVEVTVASGVRTTTACTALAPLLVGDADHGALAPPPGGGRQGVLDLGRVHVLAAGDDHVLDAVDDEHVARRRPCSRRRRCASSRRAARRPVSSGGSSSRASRGRRRTTISPTLPRGTSSPSGRRSGPPRAVPLAGRPAPDRVARGRRGSSRVATGDSSVMP